MQLIMTKYDEKYNLVQQMSMENYKLILTKDSIKIHPKSNDNFSEVKMNTKIKHIIIENDT